MCYRVSAENILSWALVKNVNGVSISYVRKLSEVAQSKIIDCNFDVEAKLLWAVVEDSPKFKWIDNDTIGFSDDYINKVDKIMRILEYTMPEKINKILSYSNV